MGGLMDMFGSCGDPHAACRASEAALRERADLTWTELTALRRDATENLAALDAATKRAALLEGLLRRVVWDGEVDDDDEIRQCRLCGGWKRRGHKPDCEWLAALADAREAGG